MRGQPAGAGTGTETSLAGTASLGVAARNQGLVENRRVGAGWILGAGVGEGEAPFKTGSGDGGAPLGLGTGRGRAPLRIGTC